MYNLYDLGYPIVLAKIIAKYANWTDEERTNKLFASHKRHKPKFSHVPSKTQIAIKRDGFNHVMIKINNRYWGIYANCNDFITMLNNGKLKRIGMVYNSLINNALSQEIIKRWRSL